MIWRKILKKFLAFAALLALPLYGTAQSTPTMFIDGNNLKFVSNSVNVAALQFSMTGATSMPVVNIATNPPTVKVLSCNNVTFAICILAGPNATPIIDGIVATLPPGVSVTNVIGVDPTGVAVPINFTFSPCDINKDGKIDVNDFSAIVSLANGNTTGSADINGDGKTNLIDIFRVIMAVINGGVCKVGP